MLCVCCDMAAIHRLDEAATDSRPGKRVRGDATSPTDYALGQWLALRRTSSSTAQPITRIFDVHFQHPDKRVVQPIVRVLPVILRLGSNDSILETEQEAVRAWGLAFGLVWLGCVPWHAVGQKQIEADETYLINGRRFRDFTALLRNLTVNDTFVTDITSVRSAAKFVYRHPDTKILDSLMEDWVPNLLRELKDQDRALQEDMKANFEHAWRDTPSVGTHASAVDVYNSQKLMYVVMALEHDRRWSPEVDLFPSTNNQKILLLNHWHTRRRVVFRCAVCDAPCWTFDPLGTEHPMTVARGDGTFTSTETLYCGLTHCQVLGRLSPTATFALQQEQPIQRVVLLDALRPVPPGGDPGVDFWTPDLLLKAYEQDLPLGLADDIPAGRVYRAAPLMLETDRWLDLDRDVYGRGPRAGTLAVDRLTQLVDHLTDPQRNTLLDRDTTEFLHALSDDTTYTRQPPPLGHNPVPPTSVSSTPEVRSWAQAICRWSLQRRQAAVQWATASHDAVLHRDVFIVAQRVHNQAVDLQAVYAIARLGPASDAALEELDVALPASLFWRIREWLAIAWVDDTCAQNTSSDAPIRPYATPLASVPPEEVDAQVHWWAAEVLRWRCDGLMLADPLAFVEEEKNEESRVDNDEDMGVVEAPDVRRATLQALCSREMHAVRLRWQAWADELLHPYQSFHTVLQAYRATHPDPYTTWTGFEAMVRDVQGAVQESLLQVDDLTSDIQSVPTGANVMHDRLRVAAGDLAQALGLHIRQLSARYRWIDDDDDDDDSSSSEDSSSSSSGSESSGDDEDGVLDPIPGFSEDAKLTDPDHGASDQGSAEVKLDDDDLEEVEVVMGDLLDSGAMEHLRRVRDALEWCIHYDDQDMSVGEYIRLRTSEEMADVPDIGRVAIEDDEAMDSDDDTEEKDPDVPVVMALTGVEERGKAEDKCYGACVRSLNALGVDLETTMFTIALGAKVLGKPSPTNTPATEPDVTSGMAGSVVDRLVEGMVDEYDSWLSVQQAEEEYRVQRLTNQLTGLEAVMQNHPLTPETADRLERDYAIITGHAERARAKVKRYVTQWNVTGARQRDLMRKWLDNPGTRPVGFDKFAAEFRKKWHAHETDVQAHDFPDTATRYAYLTQAACRGLFAVAVMANAANGQAFPEAHLMLRIVEDTSAAIPYALSVIEDADDVRLSLPRAAKAARRDLVGQASSLRLTTALGDAIASAAADYADQLGLRQRNSDKRWARRALHYATLAALQDAVQALDPTPRYTAFTKRHMASGQDHIIWDDPRMVSDWAAALSAVIRPPARPAKASLQGLSLQRHLQSIRPWLEDSNARLAMINGPPTGMESKKMGAARRGRDSSLSGLDRYVTRASRRPPLAPDATEQAVRWDLATREAIPGIQGLARSIRSRVVHDDDEDTARALLAVQQYEALQKLVVTFPKTQGVALPNDHELTVALRAVRKDVVGYLTKAHFQRRLGSHRLLRLYGLDFMQECADNLGIRLRTHQTAVDMAVSRLEAEDNVTMRLFSDCIDAAVGSAFRAFREATATTSTSVEHLRKSAFNGGHMLHILWVEQAVRSSRSPLLPRLDADVLWGQTRFADHWRLPLVRPGSMAKSRQRTLGSTLARRAFTSVVDTLSWALTDQRMTPTAVALVHDHLEERALDSRSFTVQGSRSHLSVGLGLARVVDRLLRDSIVSDPAIRKILKTPAYALLETDIFEDVTQRPPLEYIKDKARRNRLRKISDKARMAVPLGKGTEEDRALRDSWHRLVRSTDRLVRQDPPVKAKRSRGVPPTRAQEAAVRATLALKKPVDEEDKVDEEEQQRQAEQDLYSLGTALHELDSSTKGSFSLSSRPSPEALRCVLMLSASGWPISDVVQTAPWTDTVRWSNPQRRMLARLAMSLHETALPRRDAAATESISLPSSLLLSARRKRLVQGSRALTRATHLAEQLHGSLRKPYDYSHERLSPVI